MYYQKLIEPVIDSDTYYNYNSLTQAGKDIKLKKAPQVL